MKYVLSLLVGLALTLLSGCAQMAAVGDFVSENEFVVSRAARQGVARYIDRGETQAEKHARAAKVLYVGEKVIAYMDGNPSATVDQILAVTRESIPWGDMSIPDRMLAEEVVLALESHLRSKQEVGGLARDVRVQLRPLLQTAISAAYWYL